MMNVEKEWHDDIWILFATLTAFCPPPHEVRKGDYWIRHRLSASNNLNISNHTNRHHVGVNQKKIMPTHKTMELGLGEFYSWLDN